MVLRAFAARASLEQGVLVLTRGKQRLELAVQDIAAIELWRLQIPGAGATLRLGSGEQHRLAHANPAALARVLVAAGATPAPERSPSRVSLYAQVRLAIKRGRLDHPLLKYVLLSLLLAIPAFRLQQHINYGSSFGEYEAFGLAAYLKGFALWWAAWLIGVVLTASALRAAIEAGTLATVLLRPTRAVDARRWFERLGLAALYLGMPAWLLMRIIGS
jgi:apolipoprotein N-acyltransferase